MAYSMEAILAARQELARQKADRESQNNARLAQAYEKLPRLQQIDSALRRTMVAAAHAAFSKGEDMQQALEQVKQENLALQRERKELLTAHFPQDYLEEKPICPKCGGSGYLGSHMCSCLEALCRQEQQKLLGRIALGPESMEGFRLDYYSDAPDSRYGASPRKIMEKTFRVCQDYVNHFSPNSGNLLFIGGTGLGKTYLAVAMAKAIAASGYHVVYEPAMDLFTKLERAKFSPSEETLRAAEQINQAEFLIIDDLGTEMPGQFVTAALYSLLNNRLLDGKPTLITTNLNVEEAGKRYSGQIASRLYGEFSRLTFVGSDIRAMKNRGL